MKFKEFLFEEEKKEKVAVICFGRMNPFTIGHIKLFKKMVETAKTHNASGCFVYLSHSRDNKKNPLSYNDKYEMIQSYLEKHKDEYVYKQSASGKTTKNLNVVYSSLTNVGSIIDDLLKDKAGKRYTKIYLVCGEDRQEDFSDLGDNVEMISAGSRSDFNKEVEIDDKEQVASGTQVRQLAVDTINSLIDIEKLCADKFNKEIVDYLKNLKSTESNKFKTFIKNYKLYSEYVGVNDEMKNDMLMKIYTGLHPRFFAYKSTEKETPVTFAYNAENIASLLNILTKNSELMKDD